jgi:hypothetical protein
MDQWGYYHRDKLQDPDGENAKIKVERDAMSENKDTASAVVTKKEGSRVT